MKNFWLIALVVLAGVLQLRAQTNAAASETAANKTKIAPQQPRGPTTIDSDNGYFSQKAHTAVYSGHVRVDSPQMKLTCVLLTADLPQNGGHMSHIVAETNVVIDTTDEKGATNHITCDKAVYDYNVQGAVTNETVTLTGSPQVVDAQGTNTADVIIWDRANGSEREVNPHMLPRQNFGSVTSGKKSAVANTNNLSSPK